jgi:hypothetical protein
MPVESATYINQLAPANPAHTDGLNQGDSHMRLIKQVLQNTFPNITGQVTSTQSDLNAVIPVGGIIMWSGSLFSIPANYHLCDGTSGTPDLRDRFVVGAGGVSFGLSQIGGGVNTSSDGAHTHVSSTTDVQGAHTHSVSGTGLIGSTDTQGSHSHGGTTQSHSLIISEIPAHTHFSGNALAAVTGGGTWATVAFGGATTLGSITEASVGGGAGHTHPMSADGSHAHSVTVSGTVSSDAQGGHSHAVTTPSSGTHSHTVLPPYFGLYFIMRVS